MAEIHLLMIILGLMPKNGGVHIDNVGYVVRGSFGSSGQYCYRQEVTCQNGKCLLN